MPQITKNLLSVSKFASDNNVFFEFFPKYCYVKDQATNQVLMAGRLKDGLYVSVIPQLLANPSSSIFSKTSSDHCLTPVDSTDQLLKTSDKSYAFLNHSSSQSCSNSSNIFTLWHNRLGHPSSTVVKNVLASCNIPNNDKVNTSFCEACCLEKIHKSPFPSTSNEYLASLHLIHTDL